MSKKKKTEENENISFETFNKPESYDIHRMKQDKPSCFNGDISIKKYKVTIELIEESKEVYAERLQKMWDECDNFHHWTPIKNAAKSIEYELIGSPGNKKRGISR